MTALAGAGVGGLTGALIGMGIPEYEAKRYEGRVKDGGILLSVHSDDSQWTKKVKEILEGQVPKMFPQRVKPVPKRAIRPAFAKLPDTLSLKDRAVFDLSTKSRAPALKASRATSGGRTRPVTPSHRNEASRY